MANTTGSRYDLLPPNATQLERDFSRSISSLVRVGAPVPVIRTAKRRNIPASVVPWLVYEYGLGELTNYVTDLRQLLVEGVAWQRIRGTPGSILQGLNWLGLSGVVDECEGNSYRWSEFQIGLIAAIEDQRSQDVIHLTGLATPVRSRLNRLYAIYDFRRFVLDDSILSGGGILSDHSGTRPAWADGVQISYGSNRGGELDFDAVVDDSTETDHTSAVYLRDRFMLCDNIIGGFPLSDGPIVFGEYSEAWHVDNPTLGREREYSEEVLFGDIGRIWDATNWGARTWDASTATIEGGWVVQPKRLDAIVLPLVLSLNAAGLHRGRKPLIATVRTYTVTGVAATLTRSAKKLTATTRALSIAGQAVGLQRSRRMSATVRTYSVVGPAVALVRS